MGLCGYNYKIGNGLKNLLDGMIDSIEEKATKVGAVKALNDEIHELDVMISKMKNQGVIQDMFVGLNVFAKYFFSEILKEISINPELSIRNVSEKLIPSFIMTIKEAEIFRKELALKDFNHDDVDFEINQTADRVNKNGKCNYNENINFEL